MIDADVIRTILGEAGDDPEGIRAVASVLRNRHDKSGKPYGSLITDKNQFEARGNPNDWAKSKDIDPSSDRYKNAEKLASGILSGDEAPVGTFTHYYSPKGQAARGRPAPTWDDGAGQDIAGNRFFTKDFGPKMQMGDIKSMVENARKEGYSDDEIYTHLASAPKFAAQFQEAKAEGYGESDLHELFGLKASPKLSKEEANKNFLSDPNAYVDLGDGTRATKEQVDTYRKLAEAGKLDMTDPALNGTVARPYMMKGLEDPVPEGQFAVAPNGQLIAPPGQRPTFGDEVGTGAQLGALDTAQPLTKLAGAVGLPVDGLLASEQAKYKDLESSPANYTPNSAISHLASNIGITTPILATGGALVGGAAKAAEAVPAIGPALSFLAGIAGKTLPETAPVIAKVGNSLLKVGSKAAQGAQLGAGGAALTGGDPVSGAAVGAALPVVGSGLLEPLTETGRDKIVARTIREFAHGGPTTAETNTLIAGSEPTLAQATANPGIAALERGVRNTPTGAQRFGLRDSANAGARNNALQDVTGTPETLEALKTARTDTTIPMLESALTNAAPATAAPPAAPTALEAARKVLGADATPEELSWASKLMPPTGAVPAPPTMVGPADSKPVTDVINEILKGPAGQRDAVAQALGSVKNKLVTIGANGDSVYQSDPAQLYGIRQHLTDLMSPLAAGTDNDGRLAAKQLQSVKSTLDEAIEKGAPGYKAYMAKHAEMSKPIDQQKFLQGLNLTNGSGEITLAKVDNAIKNITKIRTQGGANDAKSLTDDQLNFLTHLREDLRRETNSRLGTKMIGSSTIQNLAVNNLMGKMGIPASVLAVAAHHPVAGAALGVGRMLYNKANDATLDQLTSAMLDPSSRAAKAALAPQTESFFSRALKNKLLNNVTTYGALPTASVATSNALNNPH